MNFLAWAFALGGLAVAFPILFHLIRPTPKGSQAFSSLMFLRESPPRISKRNRIDNWLLLLMRAAVVLLLATAFMRPFFRTGGEIFVNDMPGNRVGVLIDKSASMKRGDLWQAAKLELDDVLDELQPGDDVALFAFDRQIETVVGFSDDKVIDLETRKTMLRDQFATLKPTWYATDLGSALASAADFVGELDEQERKETGLQLVLISDMQQGVELGGLQTYVWPEDVRVDIRTVSMNSTDNATVRVLPREATTSLDLGRRVRLMNAADSETESFSVAWQDETGQIDDGSRTSFYVPPGTSKILRVPDAMSLVADRLVVEGDQSDFDNQFFVTTRSQRQVAIAYFGKDRADDAKGCLYFLKRVVPESKSRIVHVDQYPLDQVSGWANGIVPRLVVVTSVVSAEVASQLSDYVERGGLLLAVVTDEATFESNSKLLAGASLMSANSSQRTSERRDDYAMFASIDFSHPLFQPLSGPRFNDFTSIRFWNHLPIEIDDQASVGNENADEQLADRSRGLHAIARFDDDSVAIWQNRMDEGTVIGMATSWRPTDSQLALSTKFVPLITSMLGMAEQSESAYDSYVVGDSIQLPESKLAWTVARSGQGKVEIDDDGAADLFDEPGVYHFSNGDQQFQVAVNIDPAESQTSPIDSASLESFDVRIGTQPSKEELAGSLQKLKDKQIENRQRIWKWLLLAAICLLVLETMLAGKRQSSPELSKAAA